MKIKKFRVFKKIVVILFCLIFFVFSCFSVSAQTITGTDTIGDFKVSSVDFIVTRDNYSYDGGNVNILSYDDKMQIALQLNSDVGTLKSGDEFSVVICLYPNSSALRSSQNNVTGSFKFQMKADSTIMHDYEIYRESTNGVIQNSTKSLINDGWGDVWTCNFNESSIGYSFDKYYIMFDYRVEADFETFAKRIYLSDFYFYYQNGQEYNTDRIIDNQDENTNKIIIGGDKNARDIIANEERQTDKIIANDNKNTQSQIANDNKNHNELINGRDYADVDGSTINDYGAADSQLNSATSSAQSDSISFINNFGNLFGSSHVHNGLLAVSGIMKEFFAINWVSDILTFALGLGCFAFILGTSYLLISRASSNERNRQSRESRQYTKKGGGG